MQGARDHGWHGLIRPDRLQSQLVPSGHHRRLWVEVEGPEVSTVQRNSVQRGRRKFRPVQRRNIQGRNVQRRDLKCRLWQLRRYQGLGHLIQLFLHRAQRLGNVRDRDDFRSEWIDRRRQLHRNQRWLRLWQQLGSPGRPFIVPLEADLPGAEGAPAGKPEERKRHREGPDPSSLKAVLQGSHRHLSCFSVGSQAPFRLRDSVHSTGRRPSSARLSVTSSANSSSLPIGNP